jgi:hypothetical protein
MIGLPVAASARSISWSVTEAEATLWVGPRRGEPLHALVLGVRVDLRVLRLLELNLVLVLEVRHLAPGRLTNLVALVLRSADLRSALLELHGLAPGLDRDVDQLLGDLDVTVVVDADLADHVHGLVGAYLQVADGDRRGLRVRRAHKKVLPKGSSTG